MTKLTLAAGVPEPVEIDLLDHEFQSGPITRSVQRRATPLSEKLTASLFKVDEAGEALIDELGDPIPLDDPDGDEVIDALAKLLDLRLRSNNGGTTKPSTLINRAWKADELDFRALFTFWQQFQEAEGSDTDAPPT